VKRYGGVPPYAETQNYVRQVQAYADEYRRQSPQPAAASVAGGTLPYGTV
jgi:soluble lytic murein transglycosylase-like protein